MDNKSKVPFNTKSSQLSQPLVDSLPGTQEGTEDWQNKLNTMYKGNKRKGSS